MSSRQPREPRVADTGSRRDRTGDDRAASLDRVEVIAKRLLGAAGIVVLAGALSIVPPLERPVPGTPGGAGVSFGTVVTALATVVLVGLFLVIANELESLVAERLPGPDPLVADAGAVVKYLVVFLALVASYGPLAGVVAPFLAPSGTVWLFDLAFVLVTLLPLLAAASRVAGDLDELASLLVGAVRSASEGAEPGTADGSDGRAGAAGSSRDGHARSEEPSDPAGGDQGEEATASVESSIPVEVESTGEE